MKRHLLIALLMVTCHGVFCSEEPKSETRVTLAHIAPEADNRLLLEKVLNGEKATRSLSPCLEGRSV